MEHDGDSGDDEDDEAGDGAHGSDPGDDEDDEAGDGDGAGDVDPGHLDSARASEEAERARGPADDEIARASEVDRLTRFALCSTTLRPDEELLLRQVFPTIYRLHFRRVWRRLRRRGLSKETAEDLLQEGFATLYKHVLSNGCPESFPALLRKKKIQIVSGGSS